MSHRTFLGAMLFLHKRVFGDKYDPIMEKEVLPCNQPSPQFLEVTYRKGDINIQTKQAVDQRFYYLNLKKPYNTFLSIADYVNNGKVYDDENLIKKLHEFISNSLADFETCHGDQDGPGGQGGKGAIGGGKISV
ncbi:unnamed protein product [Rotaria sp. Silwood1]|nr:unnamed protein product [Rotaria sp. Silwood1]CAF4621188.1 unnamed protein product [Rotaria sp. Silwood1]